MTRCADRTHAGRKNHVGRKGLLREEMGQPGSSGTEGVVVVEPIRGEKPKQTQLVAIEIQLRLALPMRTDSPSPEA